MKILTQSRIRLITAAAAAVLLAACATTPDRWTGADEARNRLTELQADSELASRAPIAIEDAERAVSAAEQPHDDAALSQHLVFMADRKVATAWAEAEQRLAEDQRATLAEQRDAARLESRTSEANRARGDAEAARGEAELARGEAQLARDDAQLAREETREAQQDSVDLRDEISALNAKATERGLLVTLGDVLFDTGKADLKVAQSSNLEKLASFLTRYEDRDVIIEGHTDDVGSADANFGLSQRRAESVRSYLVSHGISADRLDATGKGEGSPVASNDSAFGRQQNRRVEVIISNSATTLR